MYALLSSQQHCSNMTPLQYHFGRNSFNCVCTQVAIYMQCKVSYSHLNTSTIFFSSASKIIEKTLIDTRSQSFVTQIIGFDTIVGSQEESKHRNIITYTWFWTPCLQKKILKGKVYIHLLI